MRARILALLLLAYPLAAPAQDAGRTQKEQVRIQAKQEARKKKEARKDEKERWKRHLSHQDKATARRLKRNKRRSDRKGHEGQGDSWLSRMLPF
jgi:hypothetical protein